MNKNRVDTRQLFTDKQTISYNKVFIGGSIETGFFIYKLNSEQQQVEQSGFFE